jgi:hypothetical protein
VITRGEVLFAIFLAFAAGGIAAALGVPVWLVVAVPCVVCAVALAIDLVGDRR